MSVYVSVSVRERVSMRLYETLTVSFRPHCLPWEIGQVSLSIFLALTIRRQPSVSPNAITINRAIST